MKKIASLTLSGTTVALALTLLTACGSRTVVVHETTTPAPAPTVTATKKVTVHKTHTIVRHDAPQYYSGSDSLFLQGLANDDIKAPSDWALSTARQICSLSYGDSYSLLVDGGIYPEHVDDFLSLVSDYIC